MEKILDLASLSFYYAYADGKSSNLSPYIEKARNFAGNGKEVVLTGAAPVWLYLTVVHALHGRVKSLTYHSPVTGHVVIFDHLS